MIETGKKAPDFCLAADDGGDFCLKDLQGMWGVLYFYSKDNTSG
jgi:thioredoxin-dependent peroxiredoxin